MEKIFVICLLLLPVKLWGQSANEAEIKRLEQVELEAVHKGDTVTLFKLWSPNYVVNNPYNQIVTVKQIIGFIREGKIDYSSVERIVEKVTLTQNVGIAMGKEIVTPEKATENVGKKVTRRYTDVWIKTSSGWRLIARQATNILVE
ncbi:nuclear transport factor 2 family protein [Fibrella forsythiae]|uniref:Nuclear transport factor 2 family protein n=1 Tax=Fibrella forsythiae TaxID=2817061 RepID=A0ABS3JTE0_9BACT|nr:nuclear transport factor 2 family protein [Fibrella forsythiae]MBO0953275.1 nuclear transport factor 2 family protein [Fibrella forsythiae]